MLTSLYSTVSYCTVLYCTVLYFNVLYSTVLYFTVLHLPHQTQEVTMLTVILALEWPSQLFKRPGN